VLGQTTLWIETQNTVAFLRPVSDTILWTPGPTAGLAQPLRFRQVGFTAAQFGGSFRHLRLKLSLAALWRFGLMASRFRQLAVCVGASLHCFPKG
jgi:hypothetical protein